MQSSRIRAEVEMDSTVMVPRNSKAVRIDALAVLHNDSEDHFVVGAMDEASSHSWQVLDEHGTEIARAPGKGKRRRKSFATSLVASNHSIRESETIRVEASALEHGARYTLRHDHFGYTAEAHFIVVHEPELAAEEKPAAKRKPAAKKKARKAKKK